MGSIIHAMNLSCVWKVQLCKLGSISGQQPAMLTTSNVDLDSSIGKMKALDYSMISDVCTRLLLSMLPFHMACCLVLSICVDWQVKGEMKWSLWAL